MKKIFIVLIIMVLFFSGCAESNDYVTALSKKGYEIIFEGEKNIIIKQGNNLGVVEVDYLQFSYNIHSESYIEYIHWLPYEVIKK